VSAADAPQRLSARFFPLPTIRFGSLILAVVLLAATGVIGYVTVQKMMASRNLVLHTYIVCGLLKDLRSDIGESHANFDLFQLSRNPDEVVQFEKQVQEELQTAEKLRTLTSDNPSQLERLGQLRLELVKDINQLRACSRDSGCRDVDSADNSNYMAEISARRRRMSAMLRNMEDIEESLLQGRLKTWDRLFTRMIITSVGSFSLALILLIYNFNLLLREIERRKEQELIEKTNAESYRMLSARILELQDVERRKIARELHDSVGQFLAGLKLNLGRLQRRESEQAIQGHPLLSESVDLTDRAILEVRTISHLLHPPLLDELGLHSAARWYVEGFAKRSGIPVELHLTEISDRLPREIELALFRVLQESLTNVHRHAKANHVDVEIRCTDDEVILAVVDDGKGINRDTLLRFRAGEADGIGLAGMRERLAELGGRLEVESDAEGTRIRATLPTKECDTADPPAANISILPN
jgi:signal transduction histidine kinase